MNQPVRPYNNKATFMTKKEVIIKRTRKQLAKTEQKFHEAATKYVIAYFTAALAEHGDELFVTDEGGETEEHDQEHTQRKGRQLEMSM